MALVAPARHRLVRNLTSLSLAAVLSKVLTFATILVLSRYLGPVRMAPFVVAQTFALGASLLGDLGLTVVTMRDIVGHPPEISRLVSATLIVQCLAALPLTGMLVLLAVFAPFPAGSERLLLISSPVIVITALNLVYALQAVEAMHLVALARLLGVVVTSAGSVTLVVVTNSVVWAPVMLVVGFGVTDALAFGWLRRRTHLKLTRVARAACWALVKRATPFIQNGVLAIVMMLVDTASLSFFGSAHDLGIYNVAWTVSFAASSALLLVSDASFPEMVRRWHRSAADLRRLADKIEGLVTRLTFAAVALIVAEAPSLVHLVLGSSYGQSASVFRTLIWIMPLGGVNMVQSFGMLAAGAQKTLVRQRYVAAIIAACGCPLAAAFGGPVEVAATILTAIIAETVLFTYKNAQLGSVSPFRPWVYQLDYLAVPLGALVVLTGAYPGRPLLLAVAVWVVAVTGAEGLRRFSTIRLLLSARPRHAEHSPGE